MTGFKVVDEGTERWRVRGAREGGCPGIKAAGVEIVMWAEKQKGPN